MITRNFNLNLYAGHSSPLVINVNQYDSGEQWVFTLYKEDGTQYIPSTGAIVGIKSDGLGIINTGSVVDGKVVINETQQMTAAIGKATFELTIDSQTHGTANFVVLVEEKPGNNASLSESDLSLIQEALNATSPLPTGGTVGQVLTKTANGSAWSDAGTPTQEQVAEAVSDWADENITVETGVVIDTSLAVAGAAADSKKVGDEISDLKSHINEITETEETTETTKTAQDVEKVRDAYWWGGKSASSSYYYVHLTDLLEGDVVTVLVDNIQQPMRFIDAYNGAIRDTSKGSSATVTSYTVPSGVDNIYVSCEVRYVDSSVFYVERTETIVSTYPKGVKQLEDDVNVIQSQIDGLTAHGHNWVEFTANSVNANTDYVVQGRVDNKKNCVYTVFGKFSEFAGLMIGHGYSANNATWMTVDDTNMTIYGTGGTQYQQFAHGLTMTDFIDVIIKVADTSLARANVTIRTATGEYTKSDVIFFGCSGGVWLNPKQSMTEVKFTYILLDMLKDVYVFGDSYTSLADTNRWPKYTIDAGYNGALLSGYGGVSSQGELTSFNNIMGIKKPKTCAWFLGMNDPDPSDGINSNWKSAVESVASYCEANGIELVLATIPNTPTMNNMFKNDYVRASGYRYVDFAKAVNAESANAPWYSGMLSSDNVHPTADGAKALASRVILDFPEIAG